MTAPVVHHGDCIEVMRGMAGNSIDAVVCDPPYGLEFMGKGWDGADGFRRSLNAADVGRDNAFGRASRTSPEYRAGHLFQEWCQLWTAECLRILKPGGHLLAFGGTRTWHRLACAVEDAGFEIRDSIAWLYGSGFPKSLDVSKAIDKAAGAERAVVGSKLGMPGYHLVPGSRAGDALGQGLNGHTEAERLASSQITAPATDAARQWQGFGTALKPAFEPVVMARKPLIGTVAANVIAHGTGALNIDATRIGTQEHDDYGRSATRTDGTRSTDHRVFGADKREVPSAAHVAGRWPANVALDEDQAAALDQMSGTSKARNGGTTAGTGRNGIYGTFGPAFTDTYRDEGGASRFFRVAESDKVDRETYCQLHDIRACTICSPFLYVAKAPAKERPKVDGIAHPTVKPLALMRWLIRLVTPPGGTVLDPFAGSGTTIEAAMLEGFDVIGIEREADYLPLIQARIDRNTYEAPDDRYSVTPPGLFDLDGEASA